MMAVIDGFAVDAVGVPLSHVKPKTCAIAELAGKELLTLADEPALAGFTRYVLSGGQFPPR